MAAKKDVWGEWDPNSPRSDMNFNPFERDVNGNGPDCSGYFPGQGKRERRAGDVFFLSGVARLADAIRDVRGRVAAPPRGCRVDIPRAGRGPAAGVPRG